MPRKGGRGGRGDRPIRQARNSAARSTPSETSERDQRHHAFTLQDEAMHTSTQNHSSWGRDAMLRKNPVTFVGATSVVPEILPNDGIDKQGSSSNAGPKRDQTGPGILPVLGVQNEKPTLAYQDASLSQVTNNQVNNPCTEMPDARNEEEEASDSDSGAGVLLFKGRHSGRTHYVQQSGGIEQQSGSVRNGAGAQTPISMSQESEASAHDYGYDDTMRDYYSLISREDIAALSGGFAGRTLGIGDLEEDDYFEDASMAGQNEGDSYQCLMDATAGNPVWDMPADQAELSHARERGRQKRAEKRRQREDLRSQGLLGKEPKPNDLSLQFRQGMMMDQVAEQFQIFLMGEESSLTFPPMDQVTRKVVHELAHKLNIKSKSVGKGDQRRPCIYRTQRMAPFSDPTFNETVSQVYRRFYFRADVRNSKWGISYLRNRSGAGRDTGLRDGDVVGAALPELDPGNRGRMMLEKMGWSNGTALGSHDNKGILLPVRQVVKKTKTGLGG